MAEAALKKLRNGKVSVTLSANGHDVIRIPDQNISPYRPNSDRERAWNVVRLMDGLTVNQAHEILTNLEPGIQGRVGRPIGWVVDAVNYGYAAIEKGEKPQLKGTKVCPAPSCEKEFQGNGWDGIDSHWKANHTNICSYKTFWEMLKRIEAGAQPGSRRVAVTHQCEYCGQDFSGVRQARFCSDKCRYDAANERRRAE